MSITISGSGAITGASTSYSFDQAVSIAGTVTYEDVTNVDSVGIVTARSGIHVTGGSVGIGTENPTELLHLIGGSSSNAGTQVDIMRLVASDFSPTNSGGLTIGAVWHNTDVSRRISYLQSSQNLNSGSTNRALCLNPNGGNIGIGTDDPITKLNVHSGTTDLATQIVSDDANVFLAFKDGDCTGNQQVQIGGVGNTCVVYAGGNERLRIKDTGDISVTDGNIIMAAGHGIDFSATGDGSGTDTSELLDDYEEGEWTPDLQFGGAKVGITYNNQYGRYTKVGNLVTVIGRITLSSKGSSGGIARFFGLPYATESVTGTQMSIGSLWYSGFSLQGSIVQVVIRTDGNGQSFVEPKGVTTNTEDSIGDSDFTDSTDMVFTISYRTSS